MPATQCNKQSSSSFPNTQHGTVEHGKGGEHLKLYSAAAVLWI